MAVSKWSNDSMLDAALSWIKSNGPQMYVCTDAIAKASPSSTTPSYTKVTVSAALTGAISTSLASVAIVNGDTSGRKLAVPQAASVSVTGSGTASRVCLVKNASSVVAYVTTCTSQTLVSGNTVTVPAWNIELRDPS